MSIASHGSLDASQKAFVEAPEGDNIRLLAPAGCGKTLCLLHRCNHLKSLTNTKRTRFLVVMFTRAAKEELSERLNNRPEFSDLKSLVKITTLNSWGWEHIHKMDSVDNPQLVTNNWDKRDLVCNSLKPVWKKHNKVKQAITKDRRKSALPKELIRVVDGFKSLGFDHLHHSSFVEFQKHIDELYKQNLEPKFQEYLNILRKFEILSRDINGDVYSERAYKLSNLEKQDIYDSFFLFWKESCLSLLNIDKFTMDDQKYVACCDEEEQIARNSPLSRNVKLDHVFVDEFQDINPLDLRLIKVIVKRNHSTLTIIGDDDQAIFGWRGASSNYILNPNYFFDLSFREYTLEINYRSPINIVEYSQNLIENNSNRVKKRIKSNISEEANIEMRKTTNLTEDIQYVQRIFDEQSNHVRQSNDSIAIIGRTRSQIIPYQIHFASKNIPFCAAEDLQIFLSEAFKNLLELLQIKTKANEDEQDTQRIIKKVQLLCDFVNRYPFTRRQKEDLGKYLKQRSDFQTVSTAIDVLYSYNQNIWSSLREFIDADTVSDALVKLSDNFTGLKYDFGKAEDDVFYAGPPFTHLAEYACSYRRDYRRFENDIKTAKEKLAYIPPIEDDEDAEQSWRQPLHLMTATRAKGKEFHTVVLLNVNNGIWPSKHAKTSHQQEEERRLFYVAFTRAKKRVIMLLKGTDPSPYIEELRLPEESLRSESPQIMSIQKAAQA